MYMFLYVSLIEYVIGYFIWNDILCIVRYFVFIIYFVKNFCISMLGGMIIWCVFYFFEMVFGFVKKEECFFFVFFFNLIMIVFLCICFYICS